MIARACILSSAATAIGTYILIYALVQYPLAVLNAVGSIVALIFYVLEMVR